MLSTCYPQVKQISDLSKKVEDLYDENTVLRRKTGMADGERVNIADLRTQKEATISQLRALNALLERQVADLEEERRKLRMEMKFRAKYHGEAALGMGLRQEQLLLVEQYVEDLKHGRSEEGRVVDQLNKRVRSQSVHRPCSSRSKYVCISVITVLFFQKPSRLA